MPNIISASSDVQTPLPARGSFLRLCKTVVDSYVGGSPYQNVLRDTFVHTYGPNSSTSIPFGPTLHVFTERKAVGKILASPSTVGFANQRLNKVLGHTASISCAESTGASKTLWRPLHNGVKSAFSGNAAAMVKIMEDNKDLLAQPGVSANTCVRQFGAVVWRQFCYGRGATPEADAALQSQFEALRENLTATLVESFHSDLTNVLPPSLAGWLRTRDDAPDERRAAAHADLGKLLEHALANPDTAAARFAAAVTETLGEADPRLPRAIDENIELSVLALDFLEFAFMERLVVHPGEDLHSTLKDTFLLPIRFRRAEADVPELGVHRGDWCVLDILSADLPFSSGPRACPGQILVRAAFGKFEELCEELGLRVKTDEPVQRSDNPNIPFIISNHTWDAPAGDS